MPGVLALALDIRPRLTERRACPAPTVGVGPARLFGSSSIPYQGTVAGPDGIRQRVFQRRQDRASVRSQPTTGNRKPATAFPATVDSADLMDFASGISGSSSRYSFSFRYRVVRPMPSRCAAVPRSPLV